MTDPIQIVCPQCGVSAKDQPTEFELIEPAFAYRKLDIEFGKDGEIEQIRTISLEHDEGEGESLLGHCGCSTFPIPEGFWDYDIYG